MTLPSFFVIGAGRSGTTTVHEVLTNHPGVFVPREKSPNFFAAADPIPEWEPRAARAMARHWVRDRDEYEALFDAVPNGVAIGDVSPVYLQSRQVPQRIAAVRPDAKLIAILRDPADRAYAHFRGRRRDGIEPISSFSDRIESELRTPLPDDVAFGHYLSCSRYHHFLAPWFDTFPREHVLVLFFDDLIAAPDALFGTICTFLDIAPPVSGAQLPRRNRGGEIRSPWKRMLWTKSAPVRTRLRAYVPRRARDAAGATFLDSVESKPLDPGLRSRIVEVLRDDILALQDAVARDLSAWLAA